MADVVQMWLRPPYELDGWRVDVANMVGRFRDLALTAAVATETRAAMESVRPDGLLLAEHGHDYRYDLAGDGWHGAMNYAGFLRPI